MPRTARRRLPRGARRATNAVGFRTPSSPGGGSCSLLGVGVRAVLARFVVASMIREPRWFRPQTVPGPRGVKACDSRTGPCPHGILPCTHAPRTCSKHSVIDVFCASTQHLKRSGRKPRRHHRLSWRVILARSRSGSGLCIERISSPAPLHTGEDPERVSCGLNHAGLGDEAGGGGGGGSHLARKLTVPFTLPIELLRPRSNPSRTHQHAPNARRREHE